MLSATNVPLFKSFKGTDIYWVTNILAEVKQYLRLRISQTIFQSSQHCLFKRKREAGLCSSIIYCLIDIAAKVEISIANMNFA